MEEILNSIWETLFYGVFGGNFLYLMLAAGAIFWAFTYRGKSKTQKEAAMSYELTAEAQKEATGTVNEVKAAYGSVACYFGTNPDGTPRVINTGRYELKGETNGIRWNLQSFIRLNSANYDSRPSTYVFREDELEMSLQLTTQSVTIPTGEFLMIMATPSMRGVKKIAAPEGEGFFSKIVASAVNTAASAAIAFYTNGYFGDEGRKVKIKGAPAHVSQNPDFAEKFYVVASNLRLLERTMTSEFERFLLDWRDKDFGFVKEYAIDQHGLLFTDNGLTLGAQSAIIDPEKAELLAQYAAEVCKQVKRAV